MTITLICLPYAGGSARVYRRWPELLPSWITVVPVQLPGRGSDIGQPLLHDWPAVDDYLITAAAPALDRPVALFGHSLGGLLALTLARRIAARGGPAPLWLGASASTAPSRRKRDSPWLSCSRAEMIAELAGRGGTPPAVLEHEDLLALLLPMLRADFHLADSFPSEPAPPLTCPITVFGGTTDPISDPPANLTDWSLESTGATGLVMLPGGHFFLEDDPVTIARAVAAALAAAAHR